MKELRFQLEDMVKGGVLLYIDDRLASPNEIMQIHCVQESSNYMPDFVLNEDGSCKEMRFVKVTNQ